MSVTIPKKGYSKIEYWTCKCALDFTLDKVLYMTLKEVCCVWGGGRSTRYRMHAYDVPPNTPLDRVLKEYAQQPKRAYNTLNMFDVTPVKASDVLTQMAS